MLHGEIQVYYHAALAAYVATWNAYISNLVRDFYDVIADPLNPKFDAIQTLAKRAAENALARFNTPNSENTRNLLVQYTGYDPIDDWIWPHHGMAGLQVRVRLNEFYASAIVSHTGLRCPLTIGQNHRVGKPD